MRACFFSPLLLFAASACAGGQTGGEITGPCKDLATVPVESRRTETVLGFSANDVLRYAAGKHRAQIEWQQPNSIVLEPAAGPTEVVLTINYSGGDLRIIELDEGGGGPSQAIACPTQLLIAVNVKLETSDGAFAEEFPGVLGSIHGETASLSFNFVPEALAGSFRANPVDPEVVRPVGFVGDFRFADGAWSGAITSSLEFLGGESDSEEDATYARWPDSNCDIRSLPLPTATAAGPITSQQVLDEADLGEAIGMLWEDGVRTEFELSHEAGPLMCAFPDGELRIPTRSTARSLDGRIDGVWDLELQAFLLDGDLVVQANGTTERPRGVPPSMFEETFGVRGVDFTSFDRAGISFSLNYAIPQISVPVSGGLEVVGISEAQCDVRIDPECLGELQTRLDTATFEPL